MNLLTVDDDGQASVDRTLVLDTRSKTFNMNIAKKFMLNAGSTGFCILPRFVLTGLQSDLSHFEDRVLYAPARLASITEEAIKPDSIFSLNDRMALVDDAMALAKASLSPVSAALTLIKTFAEEKDCKSDLFCWIYWGTGASMTNVALQSSCGKACVRV